MCDQFGLDRPEGNIRVVPAASFATRLPLHAVTHERVNWHQNRLDPLVPAGRGEWEVTDDPRAGAVAVVVSVAPKMRRRGAVLVDVMTVDGDAAPDEAGASVR